MSGHIYYQISEYPFRHLLVHIPSGLAVAAHPRMTPAQWDKAASRFFDEFGDDVEIRTDDGVVIGTAGDAR